MTTGFSGEGVEVLMASIYVVVASAVPVQSTGTATTALS